MNPLIFIAKDQLIPDIYLSGEFSWAHDRILLSAFISGAIRPTSPVTVTLEIGGTLTTTSFTIAAGAGEFTSHKEFSITVPAGQLVRWKVTDCPPDPSISAGALSITMEATEKGTPDTVTMGVIWVNRFERFPIYSYNPVNHQFTALVPSGVLGTRALILPTGDSLIKIYFNNGGTVEALRAQGGVLVANAFIGGGGPQPALTYPHLQFLSGTNIVGRLFRDGTFRVPSLKQSSVVDDGRFAFYSNGVATAALGIGGLEALEFDEPL